MAWQIPTSAEYIRSGWEGNRRVIVYAKITDGPNSLLDRRLSVRLTFEEIEHLYGQMQEAKKRLEETEVKLAKMDKDNCE